MYDIEQMLAYPSQITDYLFLSGVDCLENETFFREQKVTHVISVMKNPPDIVTKYPHVEQLTISIHDSPEEDIQCHFKTVFEFINKAKNNKSTILIHCEKGISRSASMVIAWLLHEKNNQNLQASYADIFKDLSKKRAVIAPNPGFSKQLQAFANSLNLNFLARNFPELCKEDYLFFAEHTYSSQEIAQACVALKKQGFPKLNRALLVGFSGRIDMISPLLNNDPNTRALIKNLLIGATHGFQLHFIKELRSDKFQAQGPSIKEALPDVLTHATARNNTDLLEYLNKEYPTLQWDIVNGNGNNLLFTAAYYGCFDVFIFLLKAKQLNPLKLNLSNGNLLEPLAHSTNQQLIEYIKNNQPTISPYSNNNSGLNAYEIARKRDNKIFMEVYKNWMPQTVAPATTNRKISTIRT